MYLHLIALALDSTCDEQLVPFHEVKKVFMNVCNKAAGV